MPAYKGKFQYTPADGSKPQDGACSVQFDEQQFSLSPDQGPATAFDLGDLNAVAAADYQIALPLYNGSRIQLQQFGKSYDDLARELLDAYRTRVLQCLLLEDLQEIARYNASFTLNVPGEPQRSGAAEIRLFKSNLAVLPNLSQAFQWRLADINSVRFDPGAYEVVLESDVGELKLCKLARRTEDFTSHLRDAMDALAQESAQALHALFPFLDADQVRSANGLLREGRSVSLARLNSVHPRIANAITENAVDAGMKPYFDDLAARAGKGEIYAGFKLIRNEEKPATAPLENGGAEDADDEPAGAPDADTDAPQALYWFFFPIHDASPSGKTSQLVAWEASSASGRATYFFRLTSGSGAVPGESTSLLDSGIARLSRVLGMLNFRRRPIYLSDEQLESNPTFHRYAIAARRLPEVREVRAEFVGRALHSSLDAWKTQVENIIAKP